MGPNHVFFYFGVFETVFATEPRLALNSQHLRLHYTRLSFLRSREENQSSVVLARVGVGVRS